MSLFGLPNVLNVLNGLMHIGNYPQMFDYKCNVLFSIILMRLHANTLLLSLILLSADWESYKAVKYQEECNRLFGLKQKVKVVFVLSNSVA